MSALALTSFRCDAELVRYRRILDIEHLPEDGGLGRALGNGELIDDP